MSVVAEFKEIGPCRRQLAIEVPAPAVEAEVARVVDSFRRHAKAPGFRPGKMPPGMVRQRYREEIEKEVLDRLIPRYWNQAQAEKDLDPLLPPEVQEVDFELDSRLSFVATVEVRPEIEIGDIESFELPDLPVEATEEEVAETLEKLRRDAGSWQEVERPAAEGDLVEAKVTDLEGKEEPVSDASEGEREDEAGEHAHDVSFEVGDERVWGELSAAASGLAAGEEAEFERQMGEGEEARRKRFRVHVTTVKERRLAELDDELAEKLGDFDDLAALEAEIHRSIESSKRRDRRQERERAVLDQLRERHHFPLPEGVVEREVEGLLREYAEGLQARGVDVQRTEIDWTALAEQVRPQAVKRVEARLILDAIAGERDIRVASEELEATLASLARAEKTSTVALRQAMAESGQLERLRMQLRRQKTLVMLLGEEPQDGSGDGDEAAEVVSATVAETAAEEASDDEAPDDVSSESGGSAESTESKG